jgi:dihydroxyacetone kinase
VAGLFFAYKVAGACAAVGGSLDEVEKVVRRALGNTRSMGVALSPCTVPAAGVPTFSIGEDEMEIGMGIHGEPGISRGKLEPADTIADQLLEAVLGDLEVGKDDRVTLLVNGLGATPPEELYILYRRIHKQLGKRSIGIHRVYIGEYATSLEMAGASLTIMRLDDALTPLLDAPARSPFFCQT